MGHFVFHVEGVHAVQRTAELRQWLADELGAQATETSGNAMPDVLPRRSFDVVDAVKIGLMIPSSVFATVQLAERMKLVEKIKALIAWAKSGDEKVTLTLPDGKVIALDQALPTHILESAEKEQT
jgi:hypothetical protein